MKLLLGIMLSVFCFPAVAAEIPACKISGCAHNCVPYNTPEPPDSCAWSLTHRCYAELAICAETADGKCAYKSSKEFDTCLIDPEKYFSPRQPKHEGDLK